jgi:hypothetical protein
VSFAAITLCVASQRVFIVIVYFVMTPSGDFWIHTRIVCVCVCVCVSIGDADPVFSIVLWRSFVESGGKAPRILNLGTYRFTLQLLYPLGGNPIG